MRDRKFQTIRNQGGKSMSEEAMFENWCEEEGLGGGKGVVWVWGGGIGSGSGTVRVR